MGKQSKIIFANGKKHALEKLFGSDDKSIFGYLALGFDENSSGFESEEDFKEIENDSNYYERIPINKYQTEEDEIDTNTGKVLLKFEATIPEETLSPGRSINQIAVVDSKNITDNPIIYCATSFTTFTKTENSSITFVLSFRL